MTLVNGRNSDAVILSEGREANEPKDLRLSFETSAMPGNGFPIQACLLRPGWETTDSSSSCFLLSLSSDSRQSQPSNPSPPPTTSPSASTAITTSSTPSKPSSPRATRDSAAPAAKAARFCFSNPAACAGITPSPAGKVFLLDGKYAWFYSKGDPQVQRIGAKELDDLRSPLRFLLGHTQLEKEIDHLAVTPTANGSFITRRCSSRTGKARAAPQPSPSPPMES